MSVLQGGAGFIGSHAALRLLSDGHSVTIVVRCPASLPRPCPSHTYTQDNLSRGNLGAVDAVRASVPGAASRLRFVEADLGCKGDVQDVFRSSSPPVDLVIHFAAVAFVGESVAQPLRYYHNVTGASPCAGCVGRRED